MIAEESLNLRQVAEILRLEPIRLYRLGRHLRIAPGDPCLPYVVVGEAQARPEEEERYRLVRDWLLADLQGNRPRGKGVSPIDL